jgi:hypothetical protein
VPEAEAGLFIADNLVAWKEARKVEEYKSETHQLREKMITYVVQNVAE